MSAVRLARAATGRDRILKFEGCYHGHSDSLLARGAGSGVATLGIPGSPGVPEAAARDTMLAPFNDLDAVRTALGEAGDGIGLVMVEPVAANMGVVPPEPGFLEGLRECCDAHGALLLFDEVITGFRVGLGGVQAASGVRPDLTVLGKVMGGGFPCAAFGGRADVMDLLAPAGPVYQAGTLSGNPVAAAAGIAALTLARDLDPYPELARTAARMQSELEGIFGRRSMPATVNRAESMLSVFFADGPVRDYAGAAAADHRRYAAFFHAMLRAGVYLPPSGYELWSLSTAHGPAEIDRALSAADAAADELSRAGVP